MEMIPAYVIVIIALLAFTDAGEVIGKIIKAPFYVMYHVGLFVMAIVATPFIIYQMAKGIKERDQQQ